MWIACKYFAANLNVLTPHIITHTLRIGHSVGPHGKTKPNRRQCRSIATTSRPTIPDSVVYYAPSMTNGPTGLPTPPWHSRMSTSSHEQQRKQKQLDRERQHHFICVRRKARGGVLCCSKTKVCVCVCVVW